MDTEPTTADITHLDFHHIPPCENQDGCDREATHRVTCKQCHRNVKVLCFDHVLRRLFRPVIGWMCGTCGRIQFRYSDLFLIEEI